MSEDQLLVSLRLAREGFDWRLRAVGPTDWARATPCTEWNVRDVVNHVVGQEFRMTGLFNGGSLEEFVRERDTDFLGNDPVDSWLRGCRELDAAIADPAALDRTVEYRNGPTTGRRLLGVRVMDLTVHTWDLARAIGADEELDERIVSMLLDHAAVGLQDAGVSPQDRLLGLWGRAV